MLQAEELPVPGIYVCAHEEPLWSPEDRGRDRWLSTDTRYDRLVEARGEVTSESIEQGDFVSWRAGVIRGRAWRKESYPKLYMSKTGKPRTSTSNDRTEQVSER